ncbi:MAG: hypothetical protein FWF50_00435 [Defluviitaleaceae bacterium]|nr:hypothetical protein [Defluviitaleaceae bacterium]
MQEKTVRWTNREKDILRLVNIPNEIIETYVEDLTDTQFENLYYEVTEVIGEDSFGFDEDGEPYPDTIVLEDIITKLTPPLRKRGLD